MRTKLNGRCISSPDVLIMNPEFPPGTFTVGNVATIMQVVGDGINMCTEWEPADAIYLGTIPVINYGEDGPFTISVVEPTVGDGRLLVLLCEAGFPMYDVIGDMYQFNGSYDGIETPTPPRLIGAETANAVTVMAELTEPVTAETAEAVSNYEIHVKGDPAQVLPVSNATLEGGGASVVLTISGVFVENQNYTLLAQGVTDLEGYDMHAGTWGTQIDFTASDNVAVEETSWGAIKSMFRD